MKIKSLKLTNFRCFEDFEIPFDEHMTVLVARNGQGKTSILDAIALCLGPALTRFQVPGNNIKETDLRVEEYDKNEALLSPYVRVACESFNELRWDRTKKRDKKKSTEKQIPNSLGLKSLHAYVDAITDARQEKQPYQLPIFLFYGAGRGVFDIPLRTKGFGKAYTRIAALKDGLDSRTDFRRFVDYFYQLEHRELQQKDEVQNWYYELPELKAIRQALKRANIGFSNPKSLHPAGITLDWEMEGGNTKRLRLEQFSDGYRTTLAMIMDIASRMAEANPAMNDPLQTEGIILIDEVDLHLHPGWQQRILNDLQRAFPNAQFIVSTHSPQVLSTVKADCIRALEWQDGTPKLVPIDFSLGAEAQQILNTILDVPARPQELEIVKCLNRYEALVNDDKWDSEEALELRQELDSWGHGFEPELAALDIDINLKALDRANETH